MGKTVNLSGFPSSASEEEVKDFVEKHTGEGTVFAIKVRPFKGTVRRFNAIVQFTTTSGAEYIISLANQRLYYGLSYIKAREMTVDNVPEPRSMLHSMKNITLHFGCQVSKEKLSVLWKVVNVSVDFGIGLRKLEFYLEHQQVEYKLQLSYENVWQIELRRPRDQPVKYLLIQLIGAPRIYEKDVSSSGPILNFFKGTPDDQWVRTTDFTPSCLIGQSSSICLELPGSPQLPDFRENFAFYKETVKRFNLETGSTISCNPDLVPIVGPPLGVDLPYDILFKINSLLQHGFLTGPSLDADFYRLVDPRRNDVACIEHALDKLYSLKECCYEPSTWLNEQYREYSTSSRPPKSPAVSLDAGLVYVRRVQITPCKIYFLGPEINVSNRVLRHYPDDIDNFLRVSFVDEELDKIHSTDLSPRNSAANEDGKTGLYRRILSVLRNGIVIGNKRFEFLAFSSSQLRDNSTWMFAASNGITAADIREWMGNFRQIKNVAKYAARLGQSFGSSTETLSVGSHEIEVIPDVEVEWGGMKYAFSDGIGKISSEFAKSVAIECGCKWATPSAFQIRYGGYKGVVAVDRTSSFKLSLRKSMCKYESENTKLDVLAWSKFQPCFLNRQLISLLSTLGVEDHVFLKKQREAVQQLDAILTAPLRAQAALELMSPGENTNILRELLMCGYMPNAEPYLSLMLQTFRASKLLELRTKTRMLIPQGRAMMGCLDETGTLEYGQVFVQFSGSRYKQFFQNSPMLGGSDTKKRNIVEGKVVVAKNPCLHPGDMRVLRAVNVPALCHMVDCVVFPQKGSRPHPNECSGSDLDGDIYFVCWDPELIPPQQMDPMEYTPAPNQHLDVDVTMEDVQKYFADYILNDSLGIISNAHTVFADREIGKAMSSPCIELARLFSIAVDFPKTGIPAVIPTHLRVKEYPDFMEKPDKPTYESHNVIGKLYREVKDIAPRTCPIEHFTKEVAMKSYDADMEVDGFKDYIDDAFYYKTDYDYKLGNLLDHYGIKTEAEILSGCFTKMSKSFKKQRDADAINKAVRSLRKEARTWFNEKGNDVNSGADDVYAKASAWYYVTYHHTYWGYYNEGMNRDHFLSFAWCAYDKLAEIKKGKAARARRLQQQQFPLHLLESQFGNGLRLR